MARRPPQAPLDLTAESWGRRLTTLVHAGVPIQKLTKVMPIVKQDVLSVRSGGQGMANDEALLSMVSAIKGQPVLQAKPKSGWSPTDFIGDVTSDISDLTWQAVPGLARFVVNSPEHFAESAHFLRTNPQDAGDRKWLVKHGYAPNTGGELGKSLRNFAHTPFLGAIPGVHTAAGLTSPAERMNLLHHPVITGLDVLPPAILAAKTGAALGLAGDTTVAGSAGEAAAAGRPVKALYRGLVPEAARTEIGLRTTEALRRLHLDPESYGLSRAQQQSDRLARQEFDRVIDELGGEHDPLAAGGTLRPPEVHVPEEPTIVAKPPPQPPAYEGVDIPKSAPELATLRRDQWLRENVGKSMTQKLSKKIAADAERDFASLQIKGAKKPTMSQLDALNVLREAQGPVRAGTEYAPRGTQRPRIPSASDPVVPTSAEMDQASLSPEMEQAKTEAEVWAKNQEKEASQAARDADTANMAPGEKMVPMYRGNTPPGQPLTGVAEDLDRAGRWFGHSEKNARQWAQGGSISRVMVPESVRDAAQLGQRGYVLPQHWVDAAEVIDEGTAAGGRTFAPSEGETAPGAWNQKAWERAHTNADTAEARALHLEHDLATNGHLWDEATRRTVRADIDAARAHAAQQRQLALQHGEAPTAEENLARARKAVETTKKQIAKNSTRELVIQLEKQERYLASLEGKGSGAPPHEPPVAAAEGEAAGEPPTPKTKKGIKPSVVRDMLDRMTPEENELLFNELRRPDLHPYISEEHQLIIDAVKRINHQLVVHNPRLHYIPIGNGMQFPYTDSSPVFKAYGAKLEADANAMEVTTRASADIEATPARAREVKTALNKQLRMQEKFDMAVKNNPPASHFPMAEARGEQLLKERVSSGEVSLKEGYDGTIDDAIDQIERGDLRAIDKETWDQIRVEAKQGWKAVAEEAAALGERPPVWVHNVEPAMASRGINPLPDPVTARKLNTVKESVFDLRPSQQNLGVSLTRTMEEFLKDRATRQFYRDYVQPRERTYAELEPEIMRRVERLERRGRMPKNLTERGKIDYVLNRDYVQGGVENVFGRGRAEYTAETTLQAENPEVTYLPRNVSNILDDLARPLSQNAALKVSRKATQVYKTSVMAFSLKHVAHILLGGMVFLAGRGGIDELFNLGKAYRMVKDGEMPNELSQHLDINTPDQNFDVYAGSKLGKLYMSGPGKLAEKIAKFDEFVANVQRADGYLAGEARGLKKGMTAAEAKEAGLQHAYKALVDLDGLNPMERAIVRQVFPFYAFMRHTLKYILTYPIDHPLRAAILARISDIESRDFGGKGLPAQLQSLFFMGTPDKFGNQSGLEMKQFNPFRDTGSYFTLAGFMQSLNPMISGSFAAMGIDKFTGSPGLYPDLEVDPKTGNLVAKRPVNAPWNAITTFIPEADLIDHFAGITQDMRDLKERNPEAYKNRMWTMFFLPFQRKRINRGEEAASMQRNRLVEMQQDVARATRTGDTSGLNRFPLIPYQGQLIPPSLLEAYIKLAGKKRPGVSPKSALPQVKLIK